MKRPISFVIKVYVICIPMNAFAFLDFIGNTVKETARAAAYAEAASGLVADSTVESEVTEGSRDLQRRIDRIDSKASQVLYLSSDMKDLLHGPNWSSKRLDENIRFTSQYVKRFKRLVVQAGALGTDFATAMNTAETNSGIQEMLKNQQTQILLTKEERVRKLEEEIETQKSWEDFISVEREKRERGEIP